MFTLPDLPYSYNSLEPHIDENTMRIHHDKHHGTYVTNLNEALKGHEDFLNMDIEDLLKNINKIPKEIQTKVRNNGGGHANHSLFWAIMAPLGQGDGGQPEGKLKEAINSAFGGFESFKEKFAAAGLGRFGSGWAWLVASPSAGASTELSRTSSGLLEIIDTTNQDNPLMENKIPILGLDVWEHAYYLKYQNRRAEYIEAWWNVVNWAEVARKFQATL